MASKPRTALRGDLQRFCVQLDELPMRAVILDIHGSAWQKGYLGYWYQSFGDDSEVSSFQLARYVGSIEVIHRGAQP